MSDGSGDGLFSPVREESLKSYPPIAEVCVGETCSRPPFGQLSRVTSCLSSLAVSLFLPDLLALYRTLLASSRRSPRIKSWKIRGAWPGDRLPQVSR